jgi:hypothetical protein
LADTLIRNPAGLKIEEIQELYKPNTISVNKIDLQINRSVLKDLKNLADKQRTDTRLQKITAKAENDPSDSTHRVEGDVVFWRDRQGATWKATLPECLEVPVIKYVHASLGHACHTKNIGRKVRKFLSSCDTCQRVKHPNKSVDIQERSYMPTKPGELCSIDLYGPLPTRRGGVRYILVSFDVCKIREAVRYEERHH